MEGIPPVEELSFDGNRFKSVAKREDFISGLVDKINTALGVE